MPLHVYAMNLYGDGTWKSIFPSQLDAMANTTCRFRVNTGSPAVCGIALQPHQAHCLREDGSGRQNPASEEIEFRPAVHLPLDQLETLDLSLGLAVGP